MKIFLAGYNVDSCILDQMKLKSGWENDNITPETLSASYARISRDPRDIDKLRDEACHEVDRARKSNESIIFGMGHASVAEHAVFNFDIIGISRLAVEEIQQFRLASYTEKSQRYIKLEGDYFIPDEIKKSTLYDEFRNIISFQNDTYFALYEKLKLYLFRKFSELVKTKNGERTVDGWAKEDARYVVSLATLSQFGMTVNARTLEYMLRKLRSSSLPEVREIAENIYIKVKDLAPSIIKFTDPALYDTRRPSDIVRTVKGILKDDVSSGYNRNDVILVSYTPDPDIYLCASIVFHATGLSFEESFARAKGMNDSEKLDLVKSSLMYRNFFDPVDRYFETVDFNFELIVSATNYAQLKRHRISTQITQNYDISLGVTIPENIMEIGMEDEFTHAIQKTEDLYEKLLKNHSHLANYILTNAHRRRVFFKLNGRELYHFISLREDEHAQWDIRKTAAGIHSLVSSVAPLTCLMLAGKKDFTTVRDSVFGNN